MGCNSSKEIAFESGRQTPYKSDKEKNEGKRNVKPKSEENLKGTGQVDPRLPLTERQVYAITKSWKAIDRNMNDTSINMFVR